jgi:hypothetical protein
MTKPHLRACVSCARHVRVSEVACPFCGSALGESFRAAPAPQAPAGRLTRAALFALGSATLALTQACSSSSTPAPSDDAGQTHGASDSGLQPAYGGPGFGEGGVQPVYGAPADAGAPVEHPEGGAEPAYGGPPVDSDF